MGGERRLIERLVSRAGGAELVPCARARWAEDARSRVGRGGRLQTVQNARGTATAAVADAVIALVVAVAVAAAEGEMPMLSGQVLAELAERFY